MSTNSITTSNTYIGGPFGHLYLVLCAIWHVSALGANIQREITSLLLCQLCFNFLLYHTSKIQPLASNLKLISKILYECIRTFEYFPIWIFVRIIFVSFFWYEYIRIFIRIAFLIRIYSDIRSYHLFDTNIFGYSFVSSFWYEYIRIFVRIIFWI